MGTYYRVSLACELAAGELVTDTLAAVNREMSNYDPQSTLSRLNARTIGVWLEVEPALLEVLDYAKVVHAASQGAFDITLAPVLALWGFGPDAKTINASPETLQLSAAAKRVDMDALQLRQQPPGARRLADVRLDLSALAKGHGVDRVAARLDQAGCEDYLVDIGGEVRARGRANGARPWRIGVEVPDPTRMGAVQRVLTLKNQAIATSGDYRNFIRIDGSDDSDSSQSWSHTIDPRTARPIAHGLASVSVVAPTAMQADAWATALNVLGPEQGLALAETLNLAALLIVRTAEGFEERYTSPLVSNLEQTQ